MNDTTLIARLLSKDRATATRFYREYAPKLRRYITTKVSVVQDAEELLSDTLFAFLEGIRDFQGKSSVKTYLFSICQHKIIDYYRRKKMKHIVFSQIPHLEALVSPLVTPEAAFDEAVVREKIQKTLARIAPAYRQILQLKYLEEVSVDDIAQKLSISFKSAESRLFRARKVFVESFLSL